MTRPRDGGADGERRGEKKISGAREKREERKKFQIVVWRERFRRRRISGLLVA
jgi:hypothetical protein